MAVGDGLLCGKVVLRFPAGLVKGAPIPVDTLHGIADNAKAPVPQKIDFNQAGCLCTVFFPLKNGHSFGSHLQRRIGIDGVRRNHHASGVNRKIAWNACNSVCQTNDPGPGIWIVHVFELRKLPELCFEHRIGFFRPKMKRQPFRQGVDLPVRQPKDLGDLTQCHAWLEKNMVRYHRDTAAVFRQNPVQNSIPFIPRKVHVKIRRVAPPGI